MNTIKYSLFACIFVLILTPNLYAQSSKADETIVARINNRDITYKELKKNFIQGGQQKEITAKDLEDFLPLYANYVMKLIQATNLGYMENEELISEYEQFANRAAISFWLEEEIKPTKFEEYYQRATTEINAQHVLIAVAPDATPADTLAAYNKLIEARELFKQGTSMDELNKQFSSTRNGRLMGGPLPWFGVGAMIKNFEDVAYGLAEGEISMPFRTQFGYHIVHVDGKRERIAKRSVAHIYKRNISNDSLGTQLKKINLAYEALEQGRSWDEVVQEFSEDTRSVPTSGNIGWLSTSSNLTPSFLNTVMSLDTDIPYSKPIRTSYGYHIFKIDSVETYGSEEERRAKLLDEFDDVPYYTKNNTTVYDWVNEVQGNLLSKEILEEYTQILTSQGNDSLNAINNLPTLLANKKFYTINDKDYSIAEFHTYNQNKYGSSLAGFYRDSWRQGFLHAKIENDLVSYTRNRFPEFDDQLNNYRDGLVVFKITEDSVWSSATIDSTILLNAYNENSSLYQLPERKYFHSFSAQKDSILVAVMEYINQGNDISGIEEQFTDVSVFSDSLNTYDYEPFLMLDNMETGTFSNIFSNAGRQSIFFLEAILPARTKTFDEAFDEVFVDYQPYREDFWLERLTSTYQLTLYLKNVRSAFKLENNSD